MGSGPTALLEGKFNIRARLVLSQILHSPGNAGPANLQVARLELPEAIDNGQTDLNFCKDRSDGAMTAGLTTNQIGFKLVDTRHVGMYWPTTFRSGTVIRKVKTANNSCHFVCFFVVMLAITITAGHRYDPISRPVDRVIPVPTGRRLKGSNAQGPAHLQAGPSLSLQPLSPAQT